MLWEKIISEHPVHLWLPWWLRNPLDGPKPWLSLYLMKKPFCTTTCCSICFSTMASSTSLSTTNTATSRQAHPYAPLEHKPYIHLQQRNLTIALIHRWLHRSVRSDSHLSLGIISCLSDSPLCLVLVRVLAHGRSLTQMCTKGVSYSKKTLHKFKYKWLV